MGRAAQRLFFHFVLRSSYFDLRRSDAGSLDRIERGTHDAILRERGLIAFAFCGSGVRVAEGTALETT